MKYKFIGKQPMTTHKIGITSPGDILDIRNPVLAEEVERSPLFIRIDDKPKKTEPKQKEEIKEED